MDITVLNTSELLGLLRDCVKEIYRRRTKVTYRTDCGGWAKLVIGVNTSKLDGYGILGEFLPTWKESLVPKGALVLETGGMWKGLYVATCDREKTKVVEGTTWWTIQKAILDHFGKEIEADPSLRDD